MNENQLNVAMKLSSALDDLERVESSEDEEEEAMLSMSNNNPLASLSGSAAASRLSEMNLSRPHTPLLSPKTY